MIPKYFIKGEMDLLIGAHTSAAGGVHNALLEGKEIGASTIQLFTSNQKRWEGKLVYDDAALKLWFDALDETGLKSVMSHDSYLINLGAPDPEILRKSRKAFAEEISRCVQLKLTFLNFHPGSAIKSTPEECLDVIVESLLQIEPLVENTGLTLLIEATAGQGSCVGHKFEQLGYIIEKTKHRLPIGVCIDTCHIFSAGYDIRTKESFDHTINEFDKIVGLKYLRAFHINDSMKPLGSRVDRHDFIGKGLIGLDAFSFLVNDPRTRRLPMYLETPGGPAIWKEEITLIKEQIHA